MRAAAFAAALVLAACVPGAQVQAPLEPSILPASGALRPETVARLVLTDATRAGQRIVAVGDHGFIVLSDDDGAHWRRAASPEAPLLAAVTFLDARSGWAVGHDSTILATADGGESWTRQLSLPAEQRPLLGVLFLDAQHGIAVGAYGAYYETTDAGRSWNARKIIPEDRHFNAILRVDTGPGTPPRLLIVGEEGTILVSKDSGASWSKVRSPYKGSFFGGVASPTGTVAIFGLRGRIYRSLDAGESWVPIDDASAATLMGGSRLPDGALLIAGSAGTVLVSRDDARSFQPVETGGGASLDQALVGQPGQVLLFGERGVRSVPLPLARRAEAG